ncbi:MAG: hypothetical protein GXO19_04225 [Epsilonproteobacteria bacterium]|nr:hypothetical protein [Campylobacterota bacterium]NPA56929.1 hypothetical protein [Campylobacterota bacterium]
MNISGIDATQQLHQYQHQRGQGGGMGMGKIMQSLPLEERQALQEELQSLSDDQRKEVVSQLRELDPTTMDQEELLKTINSVLDQYREEPTTSSTDDGESTISTYA